MTSPDNFIQPNVQKPKKMTGLTRWYTNLDHHKQYKPLVLTQKYSADRYSKYDNYDAINVDRVKDIPKDIKDNLEKKLSIDLTRRYRYRKVFDIHILTLDSFLENLKPPSFISGIFLGYEVIYDKINIKNIVECMRERLRRLGIKYTFIDKYGVWTIP